jgi:hypothetical protein
MHAVDFVGLPDVYLVPVLIARLVATQDKVSGSTRIKCEQNSIRPASMLHAKFFHVCVPRATNGIDMRASEKGAGFSEQIDGKVNAFVFIIGQSAIPRGKLVADFDRP